MREEYLEKNSKSIPISKIKVAEKKANKDIAYFTKDELINMIKPMKVKIQTMSCYMTHIKNYKIWYKNNIDENVPLEVLNMEQLKQIVEEDDYNIINDKDIAEMCKYENFDDSDMNAIMFIRLFWEIDGQESDESILNLKINDFDFNENTVVINNQKYNISKWVCDLVEKYSKMNKLVFQGKKGSYQIYTAEENLGYIFRKAKNKNTMPGTHITKDQLACVLYQYSGRRLTNLLALTDIKMSLALRHMVKYNKTHQQMRSEERYLSTLAYASIYKTAYDKYNYKFKED